MKNTTHLDCENVQNYPRQWRESATLPQFDGENIQHYPPWTMFARNISQAEKRPHPKSATLRAWTKHIHGYCVVDVGLYIGVTAGCVVVVIVAMVAGVILYRRLVLFIISNN